MSWHSNLPTALTSFVGRTREIGEISKLVASERLVTLTGTAGCGKTRLALRVIADAVHQFAEGVLWVDLTPLTDPSHISPAISKLLHLPARHGRSPLEELIEALREKQLLLALDNCEHLQRACAQLAENLLASTQVCILATGREPLGVPGEKRYPVSPMALPPAGAVATVLGRYDAVRLFVERARAILLDFKVTPDNAQAIAEICRRLDGIPLAIELASARVNVLTVKEIAARLDRRFDVLSSSTGVTPSHHRSLRTAIDSSYELLSPPEQMLFQRLSVFAGGASLLIAERVCAGRGVEQKQILDLLSSLVDKSVVVAKTQGRAEARYHLLETIRQYAQEKLVDSGEWPAMRDRHLECFLQLAEETAPKLSGRYQLLWLDWWEGEYDNIRAALTWAMEGDPPPSHRIQMGLRIAISIYQFWAVRDYVEEGLAWLERFLKLADDSIPAAVRANAHAYAAFLAGFRGNTYAQMHYGNQAAALAEAAGEEGKSALRWALSAQAYGARAVEDYETEYAFGTRAIQLNRELGDTYQLGITLSVNSFAAMALGKYDAAHTLLDEALELLRQEGNPYRVAMALNFSGDLARCEQDYAAALSAYEESLSLLNELNAPRDRASVLKNLGHTYLHLAQVDRAAALFRESMQLQRAQHNTLGVAECLIGFGALAVTQELPAAGARLLAAAFKLGGPRIVTAWAATRIEYEQILASIRSHLSETDLQREQRAGQSLSLEQAVEYATTFGSASAAAEPNKTRLDDLTDRENQVVKLIAQGHSNGEIAAKLVVSKRTVEKHIANILSKRGFKNRAQIVRWALETGVASVQDT